MKPSFSPRPLRRLITKSTPSISSISPQLATPLLLRQQQPRTTPQSHLQRAPKRTFLSSFFPSPNNDNDSASKSRILTATRTLPYPPTPLFTTISSVESYSQFLPFLTTSTVTHRSPETGLPTRAFLTVGYGPLSETFTSKVDCDPAQWIVEARSGAKFGVDSKQGQDIFTTATTSSSSGGFGGVFPGANEGIFEYLSTRWELAPVEGRKETTVKLEIRFEFKNQWHAAMMSAVEGQMAGVMIEAFEKRVKEIHG